MLNSIYNRELITFSIKDNSYNQEGTVILIATTI